MEWMNRGGRPAPAVPQQPGTHAAPTPQQTVFQKNKLGNPKLAKYAFVALVFSVAALLLATIGFSVMRDSGSSTESQYVDSKKMQAVFLNGGQVYFGKITSLNSKYLRMGDIYYLRVNQQVQPNQSTAATNSNDISLVKLGCELHGPQDQMVINRDQIIFWENLKDDGQVAKAVAEYVKQNPNGQQCTQQTSTNTGTPSTATTPTTTNTTPTTSTTKKP